MEEIEKDCYNYAQNFLDCINLAIISKNKKEFFDVKIIDYSKNIFSFILVDSKGKEYHKTEAYNIKDFCMKLMGFYAGLEFALWEI